MSLFKSSSGAFQTEMKRWRSRKMDEREEESSRQPNAALTRRCLTLSRSHRVSFIIQEPSRSRLTLTFPHASYFDPRLDFRLILTHWNWKIMPSKSFTKFDLKNMNLRFTALVVVCCYGVARWLLWCCLVLTMVFRVVAVVLKMVLREKSSTKSLFVCLFEVF